MRSSLPSFRDPGGSLLNIDGRIIRMVRQCALDDLRRFLASETAQKYIADGKIVSTETLSPEAVSTFGDRLDVDSSDIVVEHGRVPFPSFPMEWAPEMLFAAADFTLELALEFLKEGIGLKDATPYNVLFKGPEPVFIDILSFEQRDPGDSVWLPYAQFVRTFLLPLLANGRFSISIDQIFATRRDGLEPEDVYRLCSPLQRITPPFLTNVSMPVMLNSRAEASGGAIYERKLLPDADRARFIVESILKSTHRSLARLKPKSGKGSAWSGYMTAKESYRPDDFGAKHDFLTSILDEFRPKNVLDAGCNTGHFSFLAAERGARVVAIDYDPVVVGSVWREAAARGLDVLPLVVNLARPTPACGWRNMENPSFLDRARGSFDMVFMLALIHHLLVSERVPLKEIISLAAELTTDMLVEEYVDPDDPMFRRLTRGRAKLFEGLNRDAFEAACSEYFRVVRVLPLNDAKRCLYVMRKVHS
jgi:hypothetical protein